AYEHANETGRNADQLADKRHKPRKKHATRLVPGKRALGAQHLGLRAEQLPPITYEQGTPQPPRRPVGRGSTQVAPSRARQHDPAEAVSALRGPVGRRRDDDLARNRDHGTCHRHPHDDAEIAPTVHTLEPDDDPLLHRYPISSARGDLTWNLSRTPAPFDRYLTHCYHPY